MRSYEFMNKLVPLAQTAKNEMARITEFGAFVAFMSPDEYTRYALMRNNSPPLPRNVSLLKQGIEKEGLKQLPTLIVSDGKIVSQEGLHRARALKELGYSEIPVRIECRPNEDRDSDKSKNEWKLFLKSLSN